MESKKGAFVVLGLLLVAAVVLLMVCAKRGGQGDPDFGATVKSWKNGLLASFAKSQQLPTSDLSPNPFNAKGELTVSAVPIDCEVKKSDRAVRSATLELAGPGTVDVSFVAKHDGHDLKCHKRLSRSSASGEADDKAKIGLTAFKEAGKLTITIFGGPSSTALLRWKVE
jgi:hypothetical protein